MADPPKGPHCTALCSDTPENWRVVITVRKGVVNSYLKLLLDFDVEGSPFSQSMQGQGA